MHEVCSFAVFHPTGVTEDTGHGVTQHCCYYVTEDTDVTEGTGVTEETSTGVTQHY